MSVAIRSSYGNERLPWRKGNLHTHTTESDGPHSPQQTVDAYAARGYDFLMISDHDMLTPVSDLETWGMTLIPGNEITDNGPHLLHVGARTRVTPDPDRQTAINGVLADGGVAVLCHPKWEVDFNHYSPEQLDSLKNYAGVEIYSGVVTWLPGSALATDRWDRLLGQGRHVWGFAGDDCHKPTDIGMAWNMVQSERRDAAAILEALRQGRFYASNGVTIDRIMVCGSTVGIHTADAERISVFSDFGCRLEIFDGSSAAFTVPADTPYTYIRFECAGRGDRMAWTQPFFIERSE